MIYDSYGHDLNIKYLIKNSPSNINVCWIQENIYYYVT